LAILATAGFLVKLHNTLLGTLIECCLFYVFSLCFRQKPWLVDRRCCHDYWLGIGLL